MMILRTCRLCSLSDATSCIRCVSFCSPVTPNVKSGGIMAIAVRLWALVTLRKVGFFMARNSPPREGMNMRAAFMIPSLKAVVVTSSRRCSGVKLGMSALLVVEYRAKDNCNWCRLLFEGQANRFQWINQTRRLLLLCQQSCNASFTNQ